AHAIAACAMPAGPARVAVRPERIRLDEAGLSGTIVEAIYAGTATTLILRTAGPDLRVRLGPADAVPQGQTTFAWAPHDARLYPA
ncbi:MAG: TOBE domain-containing protein, partial [Janthinobacterium lividum]